MQECIPTHAACMSRAAIAAVLRTLPRLTVCGIGLSAQGTGLSAAAYAAHFQAKQQALLDDTATFTAVCLWLADIAPRKTMSVRSYALKQVCEWALGQSVAHGTVIAAAVHCGFPYRCIPGSPNVWFGISKRSLTAARHQQASLN